MARSMTEDILFYLFLRDVLSRADLISMPRSEVIWLSKLEHLRITFAAPLGFNTGSDLKILCHGGASTGQRQTGCRCGRYGEFV